MYLYVQVTSLLCPPLHVHKLLQNAEHCVHDTSSLRVLAVTGGNVGEPQIRALRQLFPTTLIMNAYATTETSGNIMLFNPMDPIQRKQMNEKIQSMGHVMPGSCIKVRALTVWLFSCLAFSVYIYNQFYYLRDLTYSTQRVSY